MGKKIGYPDYIESDSLLNAEFEGVIINNNIVLYWNVYNIVYNGKLFLLT